MRGRAGITCALSVAAVCFGAGGARAASVVDLGGLVPTGLNAEDHVVGFAENLNGQNSVPYAGLWVDGTLTTLPVQASTSSSSAFAINAADRIAGDDTMGSAQHAVFWNGTSGPTQVGPFSTAMGDFALATSVDAAGDLVGTSSANVPDHSIQGFLYRNGTMEAVGTDELTGHSSGSTAVGAISGDGGLLLGQVMGTSSADDGWYVWSGASPAGPGTQIDLTPPVNGAGFLSGAGGGGAYGDLHAGDMASDGTVLGSKGSSAFYLRFTNGTETAVPGLAGYNAVNSKHQIVGTITTGNQSDPFHAGLRQPDGTVVDLNSLLPANSGFELFDATAINDNGDIAGVAVHNGKEVGFLLRQGLSGTVWALRCSATCTRAGFPHQEILVSGRTAKGTAFAQTTTTDARGGWSVAPPAGTYTAGPTFDGKTFAGLQFDPEKTEPIKLASGSESRSGLDFSFCKAPASVAGARDAAFADAPGAAAAAAVPGPVTLCQSRYTITVAGDIPNARIVDPSTAARYNTGSDPLQPTYRSSTDWLSSLTQTKWVRSVLGREVQYPACWDEKQIRAAEKGGYVPAWSSYIAGNALGHVSVPFLWNQERQMVTAGVPVQVDKPMTKWWDWRYEEKGKVYTRSCFRTYDVPMTILPVAGGDSDAHGLDANEFALIVTWSFPFDAPGTGFHETPGLFQQLAKKVGGVAKSLYRGYQGLPEPARFLFNLAVAYGVGELWGKVALAGLARVASFAPGLSGATKFASGFTEGLHVARFAQEAAEAWAGMSGEYPIMATVIRGRFKSTVVNDTVARTRLAVSVMSTKFPDISVSIHRDANPASFFGKVYTGKDLPWITDEFGDTKTGKPATYNPFQSVFHFPATLIADAAKTGHNYQSGEQAVKNIIADTHQTLAVERDLEDNAEITSDFEGELALAPNPECDQAGSPPKSNNRTLCWVFHDGRP